MKTYNYVYQIRNLINNKIYIGKHSTNKLNDGYMGSGVAIKRAIKKYGIVNFKKELLCMCVDEVELNEMEIYYIAKFNSTDRTIGYNLTAGGNGGVPTEEARRKMSEAQKGKHHSDETKAKMSEAMKGNTPSTKGKTLKKYKWLTPTGFIGVMDISHKNRFHPDWILIEESKPEMTDKYKRKWWFNNGVAEIKTFECPAGFRFGRIKRKN